VTVSEPTWVDERNDAQVRAGLVRAHLATMSEDDHQFATRDLAVLERR